MARTVLDEMNLPDDGTTVVVVPWDDPVVDSVGFEVRSSGA